MWVDPPIQNTILFHESVIKFYKSLLVTIRTIAAEGQLCITFAPLSGWPPTPFGWPPIPFTNSDHPPPFINAFAVKPC